ncbi:MAG: DUF3592 domain-containing protein [Luteolibacter sp.]
MTFRFRHRSNSKKSVEDGGCGLVLFGVFWTLFSSIFVVAGIWMTLKTLRSETWVKTPCVIERFEILDDPAEDEAFTADVRYRYTFDGREFIGTRLHADEKRYKDHHDLAKVQARLLAWNIDRPNPGLTQEKSHGGTFCRVNPKNPKEAALMSDRGSLFGGLAFTCFGLGFVAIGVGLTIPGIRGWRRRKDKPAVVTHCSQASEAPPLMILFPFFGVFALAGFGILFGVIAPMWWGWFRAKSWDEVPARVLWSRVETNRGSDSTTYMPRIFYQYEWDGREFRSDRYRFSSMSSSGYDGKKAVVDAHPAGAQVTCFVNPNAPWQAVLDRRLGGFAWFSLFPLPFMAVGVFGLRWAFGIVRETKGGAKAKAKARHTSLRSDHAFDSLEAGQDRPLEFRSGANRRRDALIALALALFWNGIISVFVIQMVRGWQAGESPWFLSLFLIPFVGVGLHLCGAFLHKLLSLANPQLVLRIEPANPRLGDTLQLSWRFLKGPYPVEHLVIRATASKHSSSRDGGNRTSEEAIFFNHVLHDSDGQLIHVEGRATLHLPNDLMHTWSSDDHSNEWKISIDGKIRMRPDIQDTFPFQVLPASN